MYKRQVVGRLEGFPNLRELQHQQTPAWSKHAMHLGQCNVLVGHVAQTKGDGDTIEPVVRKWQFLRVTLRGGQDISLVQQPIASPRKHCVIDVSQPDLAGLPDLLGEGQRKVTGTASDIEYTGSFADAATPVSYTHLDVYKRQA